jgi:uncharacterized delta-60 repeat protein
MFAVVSGAWLLCAACSFAHAADGIVTTDFNYDADDAYGGAVLPMPDGRIVSFGRAESVSSAGMAMAATRHWPDGTLDITFGNGKVVVPNNRNYVDYLTTGTLQPDNKVLLVGRRYLPERGTLYPTNSSWVIARYTVNGALDKTFNKSGVQSTVIYSKSPSEAPAGVVVQGDGKIVVAGNYQENFSTPSRMAVVRYNANGSLDSTFGGSGIVKPTITVISHYSIHSVAMHGSKILLVGYGRNSSWTVEGMLLVQLNPNGSLDSTFGVGGVVFTAWSDAARYGERVFVEEDGGILVGATAALFGEGELSWGSVVRYTSTGALDLSFGDDGVLDLPVGGGSVVAMNGDMIVLGQNVESTDPPAHGYAVSQLFSDGSLDTSFGEDGVAVAWLDMTVRGVAAGPSGEIYGFGTKLTDTNDFAVFRFLSSGELDLSF